jgi:hypothetical protein
MAGALSPIRYSTRARAVRASSAESVAVEDAVVPIDGQHEQLAGKFVVAMGRDFECDIGEEGPHVVPRVFRQRVRVRDACPDLAEAPHARQRPKLPEQAAEGPGGVGRRGTGNLSLLAVLSERVQDPGPTVPVRRQLGVARVHAVYQVECQPGSPQVEGQAGSHARDGPARRQVGGGHGGVQGGSEIAGEGRLQPAQVGGLVGCQLHVASREEPCDGVGAGSVACVPVRRCGQQRGPHERGIQFVRPCQVGDRSQVVPANERLGRPQEGGVCVQGRRAQHGGRLEGEARPELGDQQPRHLLLDPFEDQARRVRRRSNRRDRTPELARAQIRDLGADDQFAADPRVVPGHKQVGVEPCGNGAGAFIR